jgi:bisphosphoglycerate-dependent phosphoglycerate mutase
VNKSEFNKIEKAVQGLIDDRVYMDDKGYTKKMTLKNYTENQKLMYDTERGIYINNYDISYNNHNRPTSYRTVAVRNYEEIAENVNRQTTVSFAKHMGAYFLSITIRINGTEIVKTSKKVEKLAVKDIQWRLENIFDGLI